VIELLVLAGLLAVLLLSAVGVLLVLHQRRQGTVRAVFMPRRDGDDSTSSSA
jgi:cell division protein FtsL